MVEYALLQFTLVVMDVAVDVDANDDESSLFQSTLPIKALANWRPLDDLALKCEPLKHLPSIIFVPAITIAIRRRH